MRQARSFFLYACFFFTGASGLVLEVTWQKLLALELGGATLATTTVLAAFMGGLGLGGMLAARYSDRVRRPLLVFAAAEILLGAFALGVPFVVRHFYPVLHGALWRQLGTSLGGFAVAQVLVLLLLLLVPTVLMGTTLPLLARAVVHADGHIATRVGGLYAINTSGAVMGALAASFVMLPHLGVLPTNTLAALVDVLVGASVLLVARREKPDRAAAEERRGEALAKSAPTHAVSRPWLILVCFFASGAAALALEVAWTRALELVIGPSVQAFAAMLAAFLIGLAVGGGLATRFVVRLRRPVLVLAGLYLTAAAAVLVSMGIYPALFYAYLELFAFLGGAHGLVVAASMGIACCVMLLPTLIMGAAFPVVARVYAESSVHVGRDVGRMYAANTAGAILGACVAGLLLVPSVGPRGSMGAGAFLQLFCAALALAASGQTKPRQWLGAGSVVAALVVAFILMPSWQEGLLQSGPAVYARQYMRSDGTFDRGLYARDVAALDGSQRYFRHGTNASVAVFELREAQAPRTILRISGKTDASTGRDMGTQIFSALLPLAWRPDAKTALVIGCGSGVTVANLLEFSSIEHVTLVEMESAVVDAAHYFSRANFDLFNNPKYKGRLDVVIGDARSILAVDPRRYDIIISEPSNPWMAGAANLFTADFFALAHSRLADDGVFVQWLQSYGLFAEDLRATYRGLLDSFAYGYLFNFHSDLLSVSLQRARRGLPLQQMHALWQAPAHAAYLKSFGFQSAEWLLAQFVGSHYTLRSLVGEGQRVTDLHNTLEFRAPAALYADTMEDNLALVHQSFVGVRPYLDVAALSSEERSRLFVQLAGQATSTIRRDFYLSESLGVDQPAIEALNAVCNAFGADPKWAGIAGLACRAAMERQPGNTEALLGYARWLSGYSCSDTLQYLDRLESAQANSGEVAYLRGACRIRTGHKEEGLHELEALVEQAPRWRGAALAADREIIDTLIRAGDLVKLRAWLSSRPNVGGVARDEALKRRAAGALAHQ